MRESNKRIENVIKEIRENQAEKEETKRIREELKTFRSEVENIDSKASDEDIARKIAKIQARKERKAKRREEKAQKAGQSSSPQPTNVTTPKVEQDKLQVGDSVRIKGLTSVGKIEDINGKMATVIFGDMRTKLRLERLEPCNQQEKKEESGNKHDNLQTYSISKDTRDAIDRRKLNFKQDIDVRGMRGDEALNAITYFIDDAILLGVSRIRILHGKGNGILRQLIRQYLSTVPNVTHYKDEHVQFGGAGITVVDLE